MERNQFKKEEGCCCKKRLYVKTDIFIYKSRNPKGRCRNEQREQNLREKTDDEDVYYGPYEDKVEKSVPSSR